MADTFFETEFGRRIPFVSGYFEANSSFVRYLDTQSHTQHPVKVSGKKLPWGQPAKDLVEFSGMYHFMRRFGLAHPRERSIDLGGAEGTCSALFRSIGLVKHATNLDLLDFSPVTGPDYFKEFVTILRNGSQQALLEPRIRDAKFNFDHFSEEPYQVGLFVGKAEDAIIDESIHGDVFSATGKYDLVSAFSCFEHLELDKALSKTRELLNPGGLFVCQNELYSWVTGSLGVIGHFPYAAARLTHADIDRYLSAFHPTFVDGYRGRLAQIKQTRQRPTIKDWFDIGRKYGLRPVAVERVMPRKSTQISQCPPALFAHPLFDHREVLADIHMFNPDVAVDDLFTSAIRIAMVAL